MIPCDDSEAYSADSEDTPNYTWDTAPASPGTTDGGASSQGSAKVISKGDVDKEKGYGTEQGEC